MFQKMLEERNLPELMKLNDGSPVKTPEDWRKRREEILDILRREIYGYAPEAPKEVRGRVEKRAEEAFGGKATQEKIWIEFDTPKGLFSFPMTLILPKKEEKVPMFLLLNFRPEIPDKYFPAEEIVDHGYGVAVICYEEVSRDNNHSTERFEDPNGYFTAPEDGLSAMYSRDRKTGWGKIGVWAWAASRGMDYLCTRPEVDKERVCVVGHSRLGKTALWAGAQDERFSMVCSNDSGCGGAAIFREKIGEDIKFMAEAIPFWFCGNYCDYAGREAELPYDQHFLLALIAPRALVVASASEDSWADPTSELLATVAAEPAFLLTGQPGMEKTDRIPQANTFLLQGNPAYHNREGKHFLSRTDWLSYMRFRELHGDKF